MRVELDRKTYERLKYLQTVLGKSSVEEVIQWLTDIAYDLLRR